MPTSQYKFHNCYRCDNCLIHNLGNGFYSFECIKLGRPINPENVVCPLHCESEHYELECELNENDR